MIIFQKGFCLLATIVNFTHKDLKLCKNWQTLELLAEVAVLEEVARLEEEVVSFRHGLYQEAVYLSSRININIGNSDNNSLEQQSMKTTTTTTTTTSKHDGSISSLSPTEFHSEPSILPQQKLLNSLSRSASSRLSYSHRIGSDFLNRLVDRKPVDVMITDPVVGDDGVFGKENRSSSNSNSKLKSSPEKIANQVQNAVKRPLIKFDIAEKCIPPKPQVLSKMY